MARRIHRWTGWALLILLMTGVPAAAAEVTIEKITLNFSGDLRLRSESIDNAGFNDNNDRLRHRFRLRLGATADVTEHTTVGMRFVSGSKTYQTSANQTLDSENLARFDLLIDRVYIRYKREHGPSLMTVYLGKFGHPFYTPTEIVWDGDLQPAGAAEVFDLKPAGLSLALAQYVIRESNDTSSGRTGSAVYAEQIAWKGGPASAPLALGIAYYFVSDPEQVAGDAEESNDDFLTNKNFATCVNNADNLAVCTAEISDFEILNVNGEVTFNVLPLPLRLVGEYVKNLGAKKAVVGAQSFGKEDTAWLVAVYLGKAKEKGDWRIGAGYTQIEADAVVANFNSDDLQQTNVNTVFTELRYQLASRVYAYYDGYYQKRNNFELAEENGNASADNTRVYRHRANLVVEF